MLRWLVAWCSIVPLFLGLSNASAQDLEEAILKEKVAKTKHILRKTGMRLGCYDADYDRYPKSYEEFVRARPYEEKSLPRDPFSKSGEPIRYRVREDGKGMFLYSVGPDGIDDQGEVVYEEGSKDGRGDLVFRLGKLVVSDPRMESRSGIFLTSRAESAVRIPVRGVFRTSEPTSHSVEPVVAVDISLFDYAKDGYGAGGWGDTRPDLRYEADPKGYAAHIYLSQRGVERLKERIGGTERTPILVLDGEARGRLEPIDEVSGHWGVANIRAGPSVVCTVQVNTHIMIAWNHLGKPPDASSRGRKEVEHSVREALLSGIKSMGSAFSHELRGPLFIRTGERGFRIYVDLLESGEFDSAAILKSLCINVPRRSHFDVLGYIVKNVKSAEVRHIAIDYLAPYPVPLEEQPEAYRDLVKRLVPFLKHPDPYVCAACFVSASKEDIEANRELIVTQVKKCFEQGVVPQKFLNELDMLAQANMIECAPSLADYLIKIPSKNQPGKSHLARGTATLIKLNAVDSLRRVILARPDLPDSILRRMLQGITRADSVSATNALIAMSQAALSDVWKPPSESRRAFVGTMTSFFTGLYRRRAPEIVSEQRVQGRRELAKWIGKEGGEDVLRGLARLPLPEEKEYFVRGLSLENGQTVLACIQAVRRLKAKDAMPALIKVLDREDAIKSLHPENHARSEEGRRAFAVMFPPREMDNLAYSADVALTELSGGDRRGVPRYKDTEILKERRRYWQEWLKVQ